MGFRQAERREPQGIQNTDIKTASPGQFWPCRVKCDSIQGGRNAFICICTSKYEDSRYITLVVRNRKLVCHTASANIFISSRRYE